MVTSLTIGLVVMLAMFGVIDALVLRPPPGVKSPERVVGVGDWTQAGLVSYPVYSETRENSTVFDALGAFAVMDYVVQFEGKSILVHGMLASHTLLPLLGISTPIGRLFTAEEDHPGSAHVAVVTERFARTYLPREDGALGALIFIAGIPFTVIGILPAEFASPDLRPVDVVFPVTNTPWMGGALGLQSRAYQWLRMVGRLKEGIAATGAATQITALFRANAAEDPSGDAREGMRVRVPVLPIVQARRATNAAATRTAGWTLILAIAVLAVACANVASLSLVRAVADRRNVAVELALGASIARVVLPSAIEVVAIVSASFAIASLALHALWARLLLLMAGPDVVASAISRDALAVAAGCAIAFLAAYTLPIALAYRHLDARAALAGGTATSSRATLRLFSGILAIQMMLATALVAEAALFTASLRKALMVDLGVSAAGLLLADFNLRAAGVPADEVIPRVHRIVESLRRLPGVRVVGVTNAAAGPGTLTYPISVPSEGGLSSPGNPDNDISLNAVTPGYLAALGVRVLSGRDLSDQDNVGTAVLISERVAQEYWPRDTPIGRCIKLGNAKALCGQIVGVVSNRRETVAAPHGTADVYLPLGSPLLPAPLRAALPAREIAIRTAGDPRALVGQVRTTLLKAVPTLTALRVQTGDEYLAPQYRLWRAAAWVVGGFSVAALALAMVGVYSVTTQIVAQRQREISLRQALGASRRDIRALILGYAARVSVIGVLAGLGLAGLAMHTTRAVSFGVSELDPVVYGTAAICLLAAGLGAAALPAIRAAAVPPARVLQNVQ